MSLTVPRLSHISWRRLTRATGEDILDILIVLKCPWFTQEKGSKSSVSN